MTMIKKTFFDEDGNRYEAKVTETLSANGKNYSGFLRMVNIMIDIGTGPDTHAEVTHRIKLQESRFDSSQEKVYLTLKDNGPIDSC